MMDSRPQPTAPERNPTADPTAARHADAMLRAVFEHAPIGITLTDTWSRRVLAANPRFATRLSGASLEALIRSIGRALA